MKVLVKEKIADSGVELLRENFDVDLGLEMSDEELAEKIGAYDAILIRSATKLTPELIERATNLKVIGRAGTGVDNVDIPAATARGIVVANAPESNSVAAAEHTLALAPRRSSATSRRPTRALVDGRWDRAKYKGVELHGKTIGIVGFGRIGQLVAKRAQRLRDGRRRLRHVRLDAERFAASGRACWPLEELLGARRRRHPPRAEDRRRRGT